LNASVLNSSLKSSISIYGIFDENVEENVVESHISKLRKKLRRQLGYDPINSVRYLGYRLDESIAGD
jgi:DNA-binding response OmpR family regulator